jgi:hypothetical protein
MEFRQAANLGNSPACPCDQIFGLPARMGYCVKSYAMAVRPDDFIVTQEAGGHPHPWCWEIQRHSHPMGVRIRECGFQSQSAAEYAGSRALEKFLNDLATEERRR